MTLKEFIEKNPSAVEEAAKCKNLQEFKSLTEKAGITFDTSKKLEKAFELVKNQNVTEFSEDALDGVSGGATLRSHGKDYLTSADKSSILTKGSGKKTKY